MSTIRRTGTISTVTLLGFSVTFGIACVSCPEWTRQAGLDIWNEQTHKVEMKNADALDRALNDQLVIVHKRFMLKYRLVDDLIAGRTNLRFVCDQFLVLNQALPGTMHSIRGSYSGRTDEEKMARNVVDYAQKQFRYPSGESRSCEAC